ncbi:MAG: aspartate kinase [Gammaproteobacteria bacterium]
MPVLAKAIAADRLSVPSIPASRAAPAAATVHLLIAGHTGQIGSAFCRELCTQAARLGAEGVRLDIAGRFNRSEFIWSGTDGRGEERFARSHDDWPVILRCLLASPGAARVFVDCTAGTVFAEHYAELLRKGVGIVTPNKLANSASQAQYMELQRTARQCARPYCYETTVGAALPVLGPLAELARTGDHVRRIEAVVSGTLSFILNRVNNGERFSVAVREARARGYTEPHPASDLAGLDSARKLLILLREAGLEWEPDQINVQNLVPEELADETDAECFLAGLAAHDAAWAEHAEAAHHRSLRLVYLARYDGHRAQVNVTHVTATDPFALLAPGENLVRIWTDRYRPVPLSIAGPGAGPELTAAGVLTDVLKAARELRHA